MVFFASFLPGNVPVMALIAIYGTVITAIFQLRAIKNVFYGPMPQRFAADLPAPPGSDAIAIPAMTDVSSLAERAPYVLLTLASLAIGFMPFLLIHLVQPTVTLLPFVK
jgi:NADH-quinone oxidoreductase subunit M